MNKWYLYIIETEGGKLYTGITKDIERRFKEHQRGGGARYFRLSGPAKIVYQEILEGRSEASKREIAIKKMSREQKLCLIRGQK